MWDMYGIKKSFFQVLFLYEEKTIGDIDSSTQIKYHRMIEKINTTIIIEPLCSSTREKFFLETLWESKKNVGRNAVRH